MTSQIHIEILEQTLGDALDAAAERWGEAPGWVFESKKVSYVEMRRLVDQVAKALIAAGTERGDIVSVWSPNLVEFAAIEFACAKIGAVMSSINTRFKSFEVAYMLKQSGTKTLIMVQGFLKHDYLATLREIGIRFEDGNIVAPEFPSLERIVTLSSDGGDGLQGWKDFLANGASAGDETLRARQVSCHWSEPCVLQYTSGTTSAPKGALLNHRYVLNVGNALFKLMGVEEGEAILNTQPFYHIGGSCGAIPTPLTTGARVVIPEYYDAGRVLELIERERCVARTGFAAMYIMEMNHPDFGKRDISSLRAGWCSGTQDIIARVRDTMDIPYLMLTYSSTEVGGTSSSYLDSWEQRSTTSGPVLPGTEMKIIDPEAGKELGPNEPGELLMRGWWQMNGYLNMPEQTAKAVDKDGWFHTGDRCLITPDGCLRFIGRYKDMLKVGGENVAAEEVEGHLMAHPKIKQAAIIGAPDPRLEEVPMAIVELTEAGALTEQDVINFCARAMANFRVPRHVHFVTEWPLTGSGKIKKDELRKAFVEPMTRKLAEATA